MLYAIKEGKRVRPSKTGERALCPFSGAEVISKCGKIKVNHWAYKNLAEGDSWSEGMTEWHMKWQNYFETKGAELEVVMYGTDNKVKHIADCKFDNGIIVEVQHSIMKQGDVESREEFYGNMRWFLDGNKLFKSSEEKDLIIDVPYEVEEKVYDTIKDMTTEIWNVQFNGVSISDTGVYTNNKWYGITTNIEKYWKFITNKDENAKVLFNIINEELAEFDKVFIIDNKTKTINFRATNNKQLNEWYKSMLVRSCLNVNNSFKRFNNFRYNITTLDTFKMVKTTKTKQIRIKAKRFLPRHSFIKEMNKTIYVEFDDIIYRKVRYNGIDYLQRVDLDRALDKSKIK